MLVIVYGLTLAVLALASLLSVHRDLPIAFFLRDPASTLNAHPLTGMVSHLGVLVWCSAVGVCFFTRAVVLRERDDEMRLFLLWSGLLTSALLLDDLFLFHESLAPSYIGLNEQAVYLGYGIATAWYLVRFRRIVLDLEARVLFAALAFFTLSLVIDEFQETWSSPWRILFEDGFKLLGIVSWSAALIRTCVGAADEPAHQPYAKNPAADSGHPVQLR